MESIINRPLAHLQHLEAEAIHIMREVVATCANPVLLYSIGKDSSVLLHLAQKAFAPGPLPFPLLHIDTGWKFREMTAFRDRIAKEKGLDLIVHTNPEGKAQGIDPFVHGGYQHTRLMKTEALRQALDQHRFDAAIGGARRDEDASRAKERILSLRSPGHGWDPKNQRPEMWRIYNTRISAGQGLRAFPLSNWTERDIWQYVLQESIEVVPLYFAAPREVVERNGNLILRDDERMALAPGETPGLRMVRFRTLGCYPLTSAFESTAKNAGEILDEIARNRFSERQGRMIDHDEPGAMENKKRDGYF